MQEEWNRRRQYPVNGKQEGINFPFVGVRRLIPIECERLQGFP